MWRAAPALIFSLLPWVSALPVQDHPSSPRCRERASLPAYFLLAGDSTTATQNAAKTGGGWGDGFLNYTLKSGASGHNYGHNGATTASFRSGGDWATVLAQIASHKASYNVFVTIQFGHNDQKSTSGVTEAQYEQNLITFAKDVVSAGGTPILVTPITRRSYSGSPPQIVQDLADQRSLTISAANSAGSRYIDLNQASTTYCNEIGEDAAWVYNLTPDDHTHLNVWGSVVFGRMVSDLMVNQYSDIAAWTNPNATMTNLINAGKPV